MSRSADAGRLGIAVAATAALVLGAVPGSTALAADTTYRALAVADGARLTFVAVDAPATNVPFEFGAPTAQAAVDSLGTNQSFASLPYPGDLFIAGPGLAAGLTNNAVTPPNYPAYVLADYPLTPIAKVDQPIYGLLATADEFAATASAQFGADGDTPVGYSRSIADSRVTETEVIGSSRSETTGLRVGPLTIASVVSSATARQGESGPVENVSELVVTGAKVGEVPITIGPDGISTGTDRSPLPDSAPLIQALAQGGVTIRYLAAQEYDQGVNSPALEISYSRPIPGPVKSAGYVINLGRSSATVADGGASGQSVQSEATGTGTAGSIGGTSGKSTVDPAALPSLAQPIGSAVPSPATYTVGAAPLTTPPQAVALASAGDLLAKPAFDVGDTYATTALALLGLVALVLLAGPVFRLLTKGSATS